MKVLEASSFFIARWLNDMGQEYPEAASSENEDAVCHIPGNKGGPLMGHTQARAPAAKKIETAATTTTAATTEKTVGGS